MSTATSSSTATQVLFDAPGPKGRRRILLLSILSVVAILALLAGALWQFHANGQLDPNKWVVYLRADYLAFLGHGLWGTLKVTALAAVVAFPFGLLLALARMSRFRLLKAVAVTWIEFFRGIPMLRPMRSAGPAGVRRRSRAFWMLVVPMILVPRRDCGGAPRGAKHEARRDRLSCRDSLIHGAAAGGAAERPA